MSESIQHKELKLRAVEYLKKLGHKDIKTEYQLDVPDELKKLARGQERIYVDVIAFDNEKRVIECGNASREAMQLRKQVTEFYGFKFSCMPYSEVKRIKSDLVMELEKINLDINKAIEETLNKLKLYSDKTDPFLRKSKIAALIEDEIERAKNPYN